jgi:hypothetical protein
VHKDKARFKTTTAGLIEMADWCGERAVELVAMEATGVYWKPVVRHEAPQNRVGMKGPCHWSVAAGR